MTVRMMPGDRTAFPEELEKLPWEKGASVLHCIAVVTIDISVLQSVLKVGDIVYAEVEQLHVLSLTLFRIPSMVTKE
ncbi:hypothetical protein KIN20_013539 [Parelaphostrongylus tenuis]|uniref:Uncharacterized protein n=1 Tax=Parelaphostrongylus tenuis TaxID=148309 RepID=A0AAD5MW93_PARTN|nr:hypothetical protein KIN20_013539 [Parelaphostrongylus tenuis]